MLTESFSTLQPLATGHFTIGMPITVEDRKRISIRTATVARPKTHRLNTYAALRWLSSVRRAWPMHRLGSAISEALLTSGQWPSAMQLHPASHDCSGEENLRSGFPKRDRMLDRQRFDAAFPLQAMRRCFTSYLRLAHFMQWLDRDCRILGPVFDENDAPTRL